MSSFRSVFSRKPKSNSSPQHQEKQISLESQSQLVTQPIANNNNLASLTQMEQLERVFNRFDVNGDGKISSTELGLIMKNLGQPATEQELVKILNHADKDGDGFIDLNEFIELNTKEVDSVEALETLKGAFAVFDIDGNGLISAEELCKVLRSLGEKFDVEACKIMISGVDVDGDGMINFDEFKVMMDRGFVFHQQQIVQYNNDRV